MKGLRGNKSRSLFLIGKYFFVASLLQFVRCHAYLVCGAFQRKFSCKQAFSELLLESQTWLQSKTMVVGEHNQGITFFYHIHFCGWKNLIYADFTQFHKYCTKSQMHEQTSISYVIRLFSVYICISIGSQGGSHKTFLLYIGLATS